ncbi:MAG: hypothetical protein RMM06_07325 [Armatimonadota bacterium]|nr:hypothetical protein [bacterium]MDW8104671.1 hypothetical protein [Armatimonadota bacterium]MDW8290520.1 hypothetical protein [Armatimonadota bacterium]
MSFASTLRFFTHVEVDDTDCVPLEDSDLLRLPAPQHLDRLEQLRRQFVARWQTGEEIDDIVQQVFALPADTFLPAEPPRYIVGYNVWSRRQAQVFSWVMRDLDRYIAALSRFALRVRVLSVVQPLPEHPEGYPNLSSVLSTIRYVGEGRWLRAVADFERERRASCCWRYLPDRLEVDGAVPQWMVDALELVLYKAQIVRILASDPLRELREALAEGAEEYVLALYRVVEGVVAQQRRERFRRWASSVRPHPVTRR